MSVEYVVFIELPRKGNNVVELQHGIVRPNLAAPEEADRLSILDFSLRDDTREITVSTRAKDGDYAQVQSVSTHLSQENEAEFFIGKPSIIDAAHPEYRKKIVTAASRAAFLVVRRVVETGK